MKSQASKAFAVLSVGLVSGVGVVIGEAAFAGLVFSGRLAPYLPQGIGLILFGTAAACLVTALRSGFPGAVAAPAAATLIILGTIGGSLAAAGDELFPTMVATIVLCSFAAAACLMLLARFRLANLVRFIPYPVSAGFVAGTGGLACLVALSLMGVRLDSWAACSCSPAWRWSTSGCSRSASVCRRATTRSSWRSSRRS